MRTAPYSSPTDGRLRSAGLMGRKAQVVTIDFLIGFVIITIAIIVAINVLMNLKDPSSFDAVLRQATGASDILLSTGYPDPWNSTNAIRPGIFTDNRLDEEKLGRISSIPYEDLKTALSVTDDVYFYFSSGGQPLNLSACGYGSPAVVTNASCAPAYPIEAKNLVRVDRYLARNGTIITMVVVAWD